VDVYNASSNPEEHSPVKRQARGWSTTTEDWERVGRSQVVVFDHPMIPLIREGVASVDPDVTASDLRPLEGLLAETVARPRAASLIGGAFALLALLVAVAGIYGVLSYAVQRRTREIGIRSALGASGGQLVSMVMGQTTRLLAIGLVLGLLAAVLVGNALSGILFGVRSWDPPSLVLAAVLLGSVGALAAWVPARRAVRIDPREALRTE